MGDDQIPHIKENTYPMQLLNKGKFGVKKYPAGSQIGPAQYEEPISQIPQRNFTLATPEPVLAKPT